MKPSRNALLGYSYQKQVTFFFLVKMDVEREIERLEIEVAVNNNFDDCKVILNNHKSFFIQIKDFDNISRKDFRFLRNSTYIRGIQYVNSEDTNIFFFKNIKITSNSEVFGLPAYHKNNVFIVSLSRSELETKINNLYSSNQNRQSIITNFINTCFDERRLIIERQDLPSIEIFNTKLAEETIDLGSFNLDFTNTTLIEGKPGIGKSHLVKWLSDKHKNSIMYRFWISNQDKDYSNRLIFDNFLSDISKRFFNDFAYRTEDEIINQLSIKKIFVIIDGFDHIENYNKRELSKYIIFFNKLAIKCKTIIFSRPLRIGLSWKKQTLENWNSELTFSVLNNLFHITDYNVCKNIFTLTSGYPILVRYIAEHFKLFNVLPNLKELKTIDGFFDEILINIQIKAALSIFISSHSFFMESELPLFLEPESFNIIKEFISTYPYLFDRKLNRIALFHDSFNNYLRNQNIDYSRLHAKVKNIVFKFIMKENTRFLSRFRYFDFNQAEILKIIKKYSSLKTYKKISKDAFDFEAIRSFYTQIRESLSELKPQDLDIINYYDLALITNIVNRDHVSAMYGFYYTFIKCLLFNGYSENDITSSEYLFAMFYFMKSHSISLLINLASNHNYDTNNFYFSLQKEIKTEIDQIDTLRENNDSYATYYESLHDTIRKNRHLGSFDMYSIILKYLHVSLAKKKSIDISSIYLFWQMYHNRKDYSIINLDVALKAFEDKNLITIDKSCELIIFTQSKSEKGIRHLLNSYIELHPPEIIFNIINKFDIEDLQIQWLNLPKQYIEIFPERIKDFAIRELLKFNSYSKTIDFRDIENAFSSKIREELISTLKLFKFKICISKSNQKLKTLIKSGILLEIERDRELFKKEDSLERYNHGVLDSKDIDFIKKNKLSIEEISCYTNGYHSVFADLQMYQIFKKEELRKTIKNILFNSIQGKIKTINLFSDLYYFVGNLPRFIIDQNVNVDFKKLFKSFWDFLELSLLIDKNGTLNQNKADNNLLKERKLTRMKE